MPLKWRALIYPFSNESMGNTITNFQKHKICKSNKLPTDFIKLNNQKHFIYL